MTATTTAIEASRHTSDLKGDERLTNVAVNLRIRVIFVDSDIVVVDKPPGLRSVPGNASRVSESGQKRQREGRDHKQSAHEAWLQAIRVLAFTNCNDDEEDETLDLVRKLSPSESYLASIPRKYKVFQKYVERNKRRIFDREPEELENATRRIYLKIQALQETLMGAPVTTSHTESAFGQIVLLGLAEASRTSQSLFIVHRLDCETSGVLLFARTSEAASRLSRAWREREHVQKTYVAKVYSWRLPETSGRIDLALAPHPTERIKWIASKEGKPSTTLWTVMPDERKAPCQNPDSDGCARPVKLRLIPVTGRTHQLRIHCCAHGDGILGDTLYGKFATQSLPGKRSRLFLHSQALSVPHPTTGKMVTFISTPAW
jgi:tRNA pseudouridine32 synthase/23S rRNA pseudouridine746 synthase